MAKTNQTDERIERLESLVSTLVESVSALVANNREGIKKQTVAQRLRKWNEDFEQTQDRYFRELYDGPNKYRIMLSDAGRTRRVVGAINEPTALQKYEEFFGIKAYLEGNRPLISRLTDAEGWAEYLETCAIWKRKPLDDAGQPIDDAVAVGA